MDYALIEDGIVINLIWLYPGNTSDFPNAVPCKEYPVSIGDTYTGGVFYRDGERLLSPEEEARAALSDATAAENAYKEGVQEA